MHLVYIGSQEEQDFLVSHLVDTEEYWIGLSSLVWQDGSHLVYNNIPYHDYAFDEGGSCFRMYPSDLLWYGKSCSDSYHYICEKEIGEYSGNILQEKDMILLIFAPCDSLCRTDVNFSPFHIVKPAIPWPPSPNILRCAF